MSAFASEILFRSLHTVTGETTPLDALRRITDFNGKVLAEINHWGAAVQLAAIQKMFGRRPPTEWTCIDSNEYVPQDQTQFPFFMSWATTRQP